MTGLVGGIAWDIRAELVLARLALVGGDADLSLGHASAAAGRLAQRDLPHIALQVAVELARGQALLAAEFKAMRVTRSRPLSSASSGLPTASPIRRCEGSSWRSPIAGSVFAAAEQVGLTAAKVTVVSQPRRAGYPDPA